ncbi:leucine-rich repeat receptor protein kinase EMS1-like [Amborella trichopoda]|nr:leucine-rich repeat receptor protein kinase EMS1-like [Amborella trichopoda]|eukprot:XP_020526416.1 leucine-rich repeat receptor protein kinase EMS1-like [Amborella trichopoda]
MQIQLSTTLAVVIILQFLCSWACTPNERRALLSLKAGLTDRRGRLASWEGNGDCCTWKGIRCAQRYNVTHVTELNLRNPNPHLLLRRPNGKLLALTDDSWDLSGTISLLLFSGVKYLEYLDLSCNNFHHSMIPDQLGDLLGLKYLNLSNAGFSGAIPNQMSNLSSLRTLDLSCSFLVDDKSSISVNLSTYKIIHDYPYSYVSSGLLLSHGLLWLERLTELRFLALNGVDLSIASSAKGSIQHLPQIHMLNAGGNRDLSIDLRHFFDLPWPFLQFLDLQFCNTSGIMSNNMGNISSLVGLSLSNNNIQGPIPPYLTNLSNLEYIDLSFNSLTGVIPSSISNIGNLQALDLYQNSLEGQIPQTICGLSSLQTLILTLNKFSGRIPSCVGYLTRLEAFDVSYNSLEGNVSLPSLFVNSSPTQVGMAFNGLTVSTDHMEMPTSFQPIMLWLSSCNLQGKIPGYISKLKNIQVLYLANNNLTGNIPSWLWQLPRLSSLDLSNNSLYGTLPPSFSLAMSYMPSELNLAHSSLHGNLPFPPNNIENFDLSHNQFCGSIPVQMGEKLMDAKYVSFSGNKLTGAIPHTLCSKNNSIMSLDLSQNFLSGTIPSTFGNCTSLIALNLAENNLAGEVPFELGYARKLKALRLGNNYLHGSFPKVIQDLKDLEFLDLGYSFFNGIIPPFIGNLSELRVLVLTSNRYRGSIPTEITQLHRLQFMDLSNNTLEGPIPSNLKNFEGLIKQTPAILLGYLIDHVLLNMELEFAMKGMRYDLSSVYSYRTGIDLSNNGLDGVIPEQLGWLKVLSMLNLSRNHLDEQIPHSIGNLKTLGSLDLSHNQLSGQIPISLTTIDSLGWIDVSFNNLSGKIPSSPHFDTFALNPFVFSGNPFLCGGSTGKNCISDPQEEVEVEVGEEREAKWSRWAWYGMLFLSYFIGFWGVFVVLALKKTWRIKYWNATGELVERIMGCFGHH